jgi:hypothetical protein
MHNTLKDEHGQPVTRYSYLHENNFRKAVDQLTGLCKGILCDGIVTDKEAQFFHEWVRAHAVPPLWPFNQILARVEAIFADGVVAEDEREELAAIMRQIVGGEFRIETQPEDSSTALPLDNPAPDIIHFPDHEFCVTGRFAFGTRKKVVEAISNLGGTFNDTPRLGTNYLVIGFFASKDWKYSSHGTKIERALQLRQDASDIAIIAEEHWKSFLA